MGMHQDRDEGDFSFPVLSISLGDDALFRMGNPERGGATDSIWLQSGDVVVMGGKARLAYHGIDRTQVRVFHPVAPFGADQPDAAGGQAILGPAYSFSEQQPDIITASPSPSKNRSTSRPNTRSDMPSLHCARLIVAKNSESVAEPRSQYRSGRPKAA